MQSRREAGHPDACAGGLLPWSAIPFFEMIIACARRSTNTKFMRFTIKENSPFSSVSCNIDAMVVLHEKCFEFEEKPFYGNGWLCHGASDSLCCLSARSSCVVDRNKEETYYGAWHYDCSSGWACLERYIPFPRINLSLCSSTPFHPDGCQARVWCLCHCQWRREPRMNLVELLGVESVAASRTTSARKLRSSAFFAAHRHQYVLVALIMLRASLSLLHANT